jgi:hypothetical protein
MVWNEYLQDVHTYEQVPIEDYQDDGPQWEVVDFDTWVDWYEPHLSNMWRDFVAYRQDSGLSSIVCPDIDFWDWAQILYNNSDKRAIPIV